MDGAAAWVAVDLGPGVVAGFTTAAGGNLGLAVGDRPDDVRRRRAALAGTLGRRVAWLHQVHGAAVHVVVADEPLDEPDEAAEADALVTRGRAALAVLVADCVPVLLADPRAGVVAAVHAGRRGVQAGVVPAALDAMARFGACAGDLRAVVGPAICGGCYEVPEALRDEVAGRAPGAWSTTSWGTPALDLPAAVTHQLAAAGVPVTHLGACTLSDPTWFSHRGSAAGGRPTGRFAAVVALGPGVSPSSAETAGLA